jgi:hypothetical protein
MLIARLAGPSALEAPYCGFWRAIRRVKSTKRTRPPKPRLRRMDPSRLGRLAPTIRNFDLPSEPLAHHLLTLRPERLGPFWVDCVSADAPRGKRSGLRRSPPRGNPRNSDRPRPRPLRQTIDRCEFGGDSPDWTPRLASSSRRDPKEQQAATLCASPTNRASPRRHLRLTLSARQESTARSERLVGRIV